MHRLSQKNFSDLQSRSSPFAEIGSHLSDNYSSRQMRAWFVILASMASALLATQFVESKRAETKGSNLTLTMGFPDARNTGVPAMVTLVRSAGLTIDTPGTVIEGLDIQGMVTIDANDVTLKNCRVTADSWAVINITSGKTGVVI